MTLGDKIRKFRVLRDLTQKELGMKAGFSAATADSRIRKYERDEMAPKADKRQELADALGIDISSLSDINIQSFADVMHILFEFEEKLGMDIQRIDGKTHLVFDEKNTDIQELLSYLLVWKNQKQSLAQLSEHGKIPDDVMTKYEIWKARFPMDLEEYWTQQKQQFEQFYAPYVSSVSSKVKRIEKGSEFKLLLRRMIQAGISIQSRSVYYGVGSSGLVLSFNTSELTNTENQEAIDVFAEFLFALETLQDYGMQLSTDALSVEKGILISYELKLSYLGSLRTELINIQHFEATKETLDDWSKDSFEKRLNSDLAQFDASLKEMI